MLTLKSFGKSLRRMERRAKATLLPMAILIIASNVIFVSLDCISIARLFQCCGESLATPAEISVVAFVVPGSEEGHFSARVGRGSECISTLKCPSSDPRNSTPPPPLQLI
jgi:hypothetical protein